MMKILLFNLGSIEHRIIAWGIDGFKSFFEQDTILWGPVPDQKFVYNEKEIPIIKLTGQTTIRDVFSKLPEGWIPDIVLCDTSVLNYVPDIYLCPVKTILFTRDSWSDTIFNRSLVELFDFIKYSVIDREAYKTFHINVLPLSGFAVSVPPEGTMYAPFRQRTIDVIAIATYNNSFYHDRYKTLYMLADSNKSGLNIKFFNGIKRSEIYSYYQRSKIVIDWAHTLSNRSFEAALNGCLLFSYENNRLIEDFWVPWEEYIPYREDNLLELVRFYANNPEKSEKIIKNAHDRILANPANWGQMAWENIQMAIEHNVDPAERIKYVESLPETDVIHRSATALLYNYEYGTKFPSDWHDVYFKRIDEALAEASDSSLKIKPLVEASRMAVLLKKDQHSAKYLDELQNVLPEYAWTYYLRGRIAYDQGEYEEALIYMEKAAKYGIKSPGYVQKYVLPVIEKGNSCDGRRITDYMWQPVYNHNNEFQVKALMHLVYELQGQAYQQLNDKEKAIYAYTKAINYTAVPACLYRVSPLLISSRQYGKLLDLAGKALENSPYDSILVLYKAYALINMRHRKEAIRILSAHREALKSFEGVRKITYIKNLLILIIASVIIGKYPASKIINEFIGILRAKSGTLNE